MVIYHYIERIGELLVLPILMYNIYDYKKYYPGKPVNIYIQLLINSIQGNNRVIATKKGKGKLPLFRGKIEWVITFYDPNHTIVLSGPSQPNHAGLFFIPL